MRHHEAIKARLLREKQRLEKISQNIEYEGLNRQQSDAIGELSLYDNHPGDVGSETFERGKDIGLQDHNRRLLIQVNQALDKLQAGTYGVCQGCGQKINSDRLQALPWSTLCYRCQTAAEDGQREGSQRPPEEEILTPPFARAFSHQSEYAGYDREDAWQAVARYGTATSQDEASNADTDRSEQSGTVEDVEAALAEDEQEPPVRFLRRRNRP